MKQQCREEERQRASGLLVGMGHGWGRAAREQLSRRAWLRAGWAGAAACDDAGSTYWQKIASGWEARCGAGGGEESQVEAAKRATSSARTLEAR